MSVIKYLYRLSSETTGSFNILIAVCLFFMGACQQKSPAPSLDVIAELPDPPQVPSPISRDQPANVKVTLRAEEHYSELKDDVVYEYWTFNGTVPGPMIRVRQGDMIEMTLNNPHHNQHGHSIDLHAVTGPGGGAIATDVLPGESATLRFKALKTGIFLYHCASSNKTHHHGGHEHNYTVADHIANGMYGIIVVEPPEGLNEVDREFYITQQEIYTSDSVHGHKHEEPDTIPYSRELMLSEEPAYVTFNGTRASLTGKNSLKASVGEKVRIYFAAAGPNLSSSFHIIGEHLDKVYEKGSFSNVGYDVQTAQVPAGSAIGAEASFQVPGEYIPLDHHIGRKDLGAYGVIKVTGPDNSGVYDN